MVGVHTPCSWDMRAVVRTHLPPPAVLDVAATVVAIPRLLGSVLHRNGLCHAVPLGDGDAVERGEASAGGARRCALGKVRVAPHEARHPSFTSLPRANFELQFLRNAPRVELGLARRKVHSGIRQLQQLLGQFVFYDLRERGRTTKTVDCSAAVGPPLEGHLVNAAVARTGA